MIQPSIYNQPRWDEGNGWRIKRIISTVPMMLFAWGYYKTHRCYGTRTNWSKICDINWVESSWFVLWILLLIYPLHELLCKCIKFAKDLMFVPSDVTFVAHIYITKIMTNNKSTCLSHIALLLSDYYYLSFWRPLVISPMMPSF